LQWFDAGSGEGRVDASGHEYPVSIRDVEPRARVAGSPVRFDIERIDGVPTAVRVRARPGRRTNKRQRRFGDLTGAGRPEEKGRAPLTHHHTETDTLPRSPTALVCRWLAGADSGHLATVLPLYAPQAVLHASDGDHNGRAAIRAYLLDSGLLSRGWDARPFGSGQTIVAVRGPEAPDAGRSTRFRVAHGQVVEQWVDEPAR
jgi:hypothetical protein